MTHSLRHYPVAGAHRPTFKFGLKKELPVPIALPDGRTALRTVLIERETGAERVLFERAGRSCHFALDHIHDEHIISLRVDWQDLEDGEPSLDADIYEIHKGIKGRRLPNREWHHTRLTAVAPGDVRVYAFKFRDLTLHLIARKTLAVSVGLSANIVDGAGKPM